MKAMNCKKLSAVEFNNSLTKRLAMPLYSAKLNELTSPVTFHFNLAQALLTDTTFIIESNKADRLIYLGPYLNEFTIQARQDLLDDKGGDNFKFLLFNKKKHEICVAEHEAMYWQAGKHVYIDLLPFREFEPKIEGPVSFRVRIE